MLLIDELILRNFLVFVSGFSPLVAWFLSDVKQLNNWRAVLVVQSALFSLFLYVLFFLPYLQSKTVPALLSLYPLFMFLFNLAFLLKFGAQCFSRICSVSVMLGFALTEFHELPAFAFSFFNLEFLDPGKLIFLLSPVYALAVVFLAAKVFNLSLSGRSKAVLLLSVLGIWIFYWINPLIDINGAPSALSYVKRFYCFAILAAAFLIGGDPQNE